MDDSKRGNNIHSLGWSIDTKYLLCAGYIVGSLGDGGERDPSPQPKRTTQ